MVFKRDDGVNNAVAVIHRPKLQGRETCSPFRS